jgi:hypothetical protein
MLAVAKLDLEVAGIGCAPGGAMPQARTVYVRHLRCPIGNPRCRPLGMRRGVTRDFTSFIRSLPLVRSLLWAWRSHGAVVVDCS